MSREEANEIVRGAERARRARRLAGRVALPTAAALGVGAAIAVGTIPGSGGVITGCYDTTPASIPPYITPGTLRVIDPTNTGGAAAPNPAAYYSCSSNESTITWNQQGPPGAPGGQGATGPQGATGDQGPAGSPASTEGSILGLGKGAGHLFLKIEGIPGESKDHKHKDSIEISDFSFGVQQAGTQAHGGGGGAGKTSFASFTITKKVDSASPKLLSFASHGNHIKKVELSISKAVKGESVDYLKFDFSDVMISGIKLGGGGGELPNETVSLNFSKVVENFYKEKKLQGSITLGASQIKL